MRKNLLAKADDAEAAYNKGYVLLDQYRFAEAIPYRQQALADVPLPEFYLALGRAYYALPNLAEAEKVLREGLTAANDENSEALLANRLAIALNAKGNLDGALQYMQRALKINEKIYGQDHPYVATSANNIGMILLAKGNLDKALEYTQRALNIDLKVYGRDRQTVATDASNIGQIFEAKGNLNEALQSIRSCTVPITPKWLYANNMGQILKAKGDLEGALQYTQQALTIFHSTYGPDNPNTKTVVTNSEEIKKAMQGMAPGNVPPKL